MPTKETKKGLVMVVFCPGSTKSQMITIQITSGSKKGFQDPCPQHDQRVVRMAYNNYLATFFEVRDGKMVEYPPRLIREVWGSISYDWEILALFFSLNNLSPEWIYCNDTWGWLDKDTGHWTGAVGKVQFHWKLFKVCSKLFSLSWTKQT